MPLARGQSSSKLGVAIAAVVVIAIAGYMIFSAMGPSAEEQLVAFRERGDALRQTISRELNKQDRFNQVTLRVEVTEKPALKGRIEIAGSVPSQPDLEALNAYLGGATPPEGFTIENTVQVVARSASTPTPGAPQPPGPAGGDRTIKGE